MKESQIRGNGKFVRKGGSGILDRHVNHRTDCSHVERYGVEPLKSGVISNSQSVRR
jgi:hypothetical protein